MPPKRGIAKLAKDFFVQAVVANTINVAINTVIDEPTETQETGIRIGSQVAGLLVMSKVQERTDRMLDAAVNWRTNRKVAESLPV